MQSCRLLHFACRASDPERLGHFYANLFDGRFFIHPVMCALGIVIVKLPEPKGCFSSLLEFWPWDIEWDGRRGVFHRIAPRPTPTSYGHLAIHVAQSGEQVIAELEQRKVPYRIEPRGPGLNIPCIDDPEGNMVEIFPDVDDMPLPPEAFCAPGQASAVIAALKQQLAERHGGKIPDEVPLMG